MTIFDFLKDPSRTNKHVLELLLCHHLGFSGKDDILRSYDTTVAHDKETAILKDYHRHMDDKEPLEYILGHVTFFERDFVVTPATLIPRPETEYMIQAVIDHAHTLTTSQAYLYDIGTGCGILGISNFLECPQVYKNVVCCDLSPDALEVAKKNLTRLVDSPDQQKFAFVQSSLIDFLKVGKTTTNFQATEHPIFVANLPYIPDDTFAQDADESAQKREPLMAFLGGNDGLDLYRIFLDDIAGLVSDAPVYQQSVLFLEMMTRQVEILREAYDASRIFEEVKTFHSNIRIVKATLR